MNLNNHYIEEVHSVKPHSMDWTFKFPSKLFVKVELTVRINAGVVQKHHRIWDIGEWENIKAKGYYVE